MGLKFNFFNFSLFSNFLQVPPVLFEQPPGLVTVRIDPDTGLLADGKDRKAVFETFFADHVPTREAGSGDENSSTEGTPAAPEQLF